MIVTQRYKKYLFSELFLFTFDKNFLIMRKLSLLLIVLSLYNCKPKKIYIENTKIERDSIYINKIVKEVERKLGYLINYSYICIGRVVATNNNIIQIPTMTKTTTF